MLKTRSLLRFAGGVSLLALAAAPLHAQRVGIIAGATFSSLRNSDDIDFSRRQGTVFGASLQLPLGAAVTLQPEIMFLNKGAKFSEGGTSGNIRLDYLEVPVLLRYDFSRALVGPHVYAGPSIGFNVGCKIDGQGNSSLPKSDCTTDNFKPNKIDYGLTVGTGVDFNLGGIAATGGVRYGIGLADIRKDDRGEFKTRVNNGVLTLYVGLLFGSLNK